MSINTKTIIKISGLVVFFLLMIAYGLFVSRNLILGVKIRSVDLNGTPATSGATITTNIIKITGNAKNAIFLSLDDREISVDQIGNFDETIALLPGYNIIDIKAKDKFGYTDEKNYKLMFAPR